MEFFLFWGMCLFPSGLLALFPTPYLVLEEWRKVGGEKNFSLLCQQLLNNPALGQELSNTVSSTKKGDACGDVLLENTTGPQSGTKWNKEICKKKQRHMWSERRPVHYWHKTLHKILRLLDSTQHKHCCTVKPHKEHSLMCKIWLTLTYQTMQWGKLKRLALSKTNMQITPCTLPWKAATGLFLLRQSLSRKLTMDLIQAKLNL